jgi:cytochrome b
MRSLHAARVNFHLGFISSGIALDQIALIAVVHVADAIISSTWTRKHEIVQTLTGLNIANDEGKCRKEAATSQR